MWKLLYFFLFSSQLSNCEWLLLRENIAPISGFDNESNIMQEKEQYSYYSSINENMAFNVTDINFGFEKIQLIFRISETRSMLLIFNENGQQFKEVKREKFIDHTFICSFEIVPDQQTYIYFVFVIEEIVQISHVQLLVNDCRKGCKKCSNEYCQVCEDDFFIEWEQQKFCLTQATKENIKCLQFQHFSQTYESCLHYNIISSYEISNIFQNKLIIDQTDSQLGNISIDDQIFKGPYQQNDNLLINLNQKFKELTNINIEFTQFILGEMILFPVIRIQINNYDSLVTQSYQQKYKYKCISNFSEKCFSIKIAISIENIQNLSNLTIKNTYPLHEYDKGWTIGKITIKEYQYLPCQFKIYDKYCVKQCPIFTEESEKNVCINVFKEKYINLLSQKLFSITEYQNSKINTQFLPPFFQYQQEFYFSFYNNYQFNEQASENFSSIIIYFKLLIFNPDIQSKISVSVQHHKKEYFFKDFVKTDLRIGKENITLYYLGVNKEYIVLQNFENQINFKILCSHLNQMLCAISKIFIFKISCPEFANKSNCGIIDNSKINFDYLCLDGYYYENFSCQDCSQNHCIKCADKYKCIACAQGFVLYSDQCFYNFQNQIYTNQIFTFGNYKNNWFNYNHLSYCLNQTEIQNQQYCECRAGYFFQNDIGCKKCSQTCFECNNNPNNCQKCAELSNRILEAHVCVCKEGYYETEDNQKCEQCSKHCKSCSYSPFVCSNCFTEQNRILKENQCICMEGYYLDIIKDICLKCSSVCEKCRIDGKCLKCFENQNRYLTINNECKCKDGFYEDEQNNCIACHYSCQSCDNSEEFNKCIECPSNRIKKNQNLNHFECICEQGYYDDGAQICKDCSQINSANPGDYCYSYCGDGIVQWNEDCDNGELIIRNDCYKCKFSLSKCNPDLCLVCLKQECQQCYAGYYLDLDYSCKKCSIQCLTCSKNPDNCIECSTNTNQCSLCSQSDGYEYKNQECLPVCGDGFIVNQEECDDQNLIDNDGCDKTCKIEKGFQCYGNICLNNKEKLIIKENKLDKVYENQRSFIFYIENSKNLNINDLQFHLDEQILFFVEGVNITVFEQSDFEKGNLQFKIKFSLEKSLENQQLIVNLKGNNHFAKIHVLPYFNKKDYQYYYLDDILLDLTEILLNIFFYLNFISIIFIPDFTLSEIYSTLLQFSFLNYLNLILPYNFNRFISEFKINEIMSIFSNHQDKTIYDENLQELFLFKIQNYLNSDVQLNFIFYFLLILVGIFICKIILQILLLKYLNQRMILKQEYLLQDFKRFIWSRLSYFQFQINFLILSNIFLAQGIIRRVLNAISLYMFIKSILKYKVFKLQIQIILLITDVLIILAYIFLLDQILLISLLLTLSITKIFVQIYVKQSKIDFCDKLFISISLILNLIYILILQFIQLTGNNYSAMSSAGTIIILLSNILLILGLFLMIYKILQLSKRQIYLITSIIMRKGNKIEGYFQCTL